MSVDLESRPAEPARPGDAPGARAIRPPRRRRRPARQIVAIIIAIISLLPLLVLVVSAFRPAADVFSATFPKHFTFDNFTQSINGQFGRYLLNSFIVSTVVTVAALFLHSMAGFALARLNFPGRGVIFGGIIATLLVSLPVVLVPTFLLVKQLHLLDSYAGLIIPSIFNAFGIFWLRQFYLSIPNELEDAARSDGCGWFGVWWHVAVPLSRPVLASLAVLFFLTNWNSYLWPLTILGNSNLFTVQVGIASLQSQYSGSYNLIMAASLVVAIPTIILFVIFQRQIVDSFKNAGLK
jgi:multiple sugar transport system permease protein